MPLMLGGIGGALMLPFVTVTSELSSTMVLYSGPLDHDGRDVAGARRQQPGVAAAAATVLIVWTAVPVALVYRLPRRYELSML